MVVIFMKSIQEFGSRIYQQSFKVAIPILPYRNPKRLCSLQQLADVLKTEYKDKVLIVTDPGIVKAGLLKKVTDVLDKAYIDYYVYDQTIPNPTIANIKEAKAIYEVNGCQALIGLGGGSSMDCAKGVGASIARPDLTIQQMKGVLKVIKPLPLLIAIPTTAGSGSETTLAAVITDETTHHKYPINDFVLIPDYALLDPIMTASLPKHITSTTGMDALTHAVEAYIGKSTTAKTRRQALKATQLIFANIKQAYDDGSNLIVRGNMSDAAYLAGCAFTVSYVGYVHAVAHSLGGKYGIAHGLANAVLLPHVLKAYGSTIYPRLSELALAAGLVDESMSQTKAAKRFIEAIEQLNASMDIPTKLKGIQVKDIPLMARNAAKEANPLYPVPVYMNAKQLEQFYYDVMEEIYDS